MNKFNLYWFIVDSVRTYKTGLDDRDRIDIIDELGVDGIEFTNCVTGSPSSLLSAGTIFTGLPSTFVARHFNDWKFTGMEISTIATLEKEYQYQIYSILDNRELREILHKLVPPLKHRELPNKFNLSDFVWHNSEITDLFQYFLSSEKQITNRAYILWYDCRRDPETNRYVKEAINAIKEHGDYENSIIIIHSDHGYPDPRTQLDEEYFKGIGHDMMLTDDNIKVPFVIKYPGCPRGVIKEHQVGLVDVIPTIFDILNIDYIKLNTSFQGKSLLPIIRGEEEDFRIRRTDTRLPMDVKRIGCIRSNQFKYTYLYNDEIELFYDLKNDPQELENVVEKPEYENDSKKFRAINNKYEEELFLFHDTQVHKNLNTSISQIKRQLKLESPKILIITKGIQLLVDLLVKQFRKDFNNPDIELIFSGGKSISVSGISNVHFIENIDDTSIKSLGIQNVDLALFLTENSSRVFIKKDQVDAVKSIKSKKSFLMNYNFELFNYFSSKWLNMAYVKLFFDWDTKGYFYKQEPLYFLKDLMVFIKYVFIKLKLHLSKSKADIDLKAARDTIFYRKAIMEMNSSGKYQVMDKDEYKYEVERINVRED